jgi:hypothetical protein
MLNPDAGAAGTYQGPVSTRLDVGCRALGVVLIAPPLRRPAASWSSEGEIGMRYVVTWRERPTDSDAEFEEARKRVVEAFSTSEMPVSLTIHQFVARIGLGGYAVVETDEPADLQYLLRVYAPASFTVEPLIEALAAVTTEMRGLDRRYLLQNN